MPTRQYKTVSHSAVKLTRSTVATGDEAETIEFSELRTKKRFLRIKGKMARKRKEQKRKEKKRKEEDEDEGWKRRRKENEHSSSRSD